MYNSIFLENWQHIIYFDIMIKAENISYNKNLSEKLIVRVRVIFRFNMF